MSAETITTLNNSTLIGFTAKRGNAWHYRASMQGAESNHYEGAIPVEDVRRRLLDWTAEEAPVQYAVLGANGVETVTDEGRKVIFRSDTHAALGVFSNGYQIHQYDEWLVKNVENLVDGDLQVASAGVLRGGAWAWVQIESPDTREVAGFQHRPFILAATSMDGYLATTYQRATQAVVCDNTLSVAIREGENGKSAAYKVRHSSGSLARISGVREALGLVMNAGDEFEAEVQRLLDDTVDDARWGKFLDAHLGLGDDASKMAVTLGEKKREQLNDLFFSDERVAPWTGTAFGVMQAVNTWNHHVQGVRGGTAGDRNMTRAIQGKVDAMDRGTLALLATV